MDADYIFDIDNLFSDDEDLELDVSTIAYLIDISKKKTLFWEVYRFKVLIPIIELFLTTSCFNDKAL